MEFHFGIQSHRNTIRRHQNSIQNQNLYIAIGYHSEYIPKLNQLGNLL
jgi:hypothetical protein